MSSSLRDQLVAAGLADKKRARRTDHERRVQKQQQKKAQSKPSSTAVVQTPAELARQAALQKAERDRKLNEKREKQREKKERAAQIRQMIEMHRLDRTDGEVAYRFKAGTRIEKIYVTDAIQQKLARGELGIVRLGHKFEVVTAEVAEKIRQRDAGVVVQLLDGSADDEDDFFTQS